MGRIRGHVAVGLAPGSWVLLVSRIVDAVKRAPITVAHTLPRIQCGVRGKPGPRLLRFSQADGGLCGSCEPASNNIQSGGYNLRGGGTSHTVSEQLPKGAGGRCVPSIGSKGKRLIPAVR